MLSSFPATTLCQSPPGAVAPTTTSLLAVICAPAERPVHPAPSAPAPITALPLSSTSPVGNPESLNTLETKMKYKHQTSLGNRLTARKVGTRPPGFQIAIGR